MDTIVNRKNTDILEVFGPRIWFLVPPTNIDTDYCVMQGSIPGGMSVALHSHPDPESFFILSGKAQVLLPANDTLQWTNVKTGDMIHIPGNRKHAWKNLSDKPLQSLVTTTSPLGRFFLEVAKKVNRYQEVLPVTPEDLQHFVQVAQQYDHWLGSPEENAEYDIPVFGT